jgi:ankyrin repeat protein
VVQIVRLLLKAGSETDVCESKDQRSPLYAAVSQQYVEAVNLLIEAGKSLNNSETMQVAVNLMQ